MSTTSSLQASDVISGWPDASREAAELVLKARGEPTVVTAERLVWQDAAPWKRIIATRTYYDHAFPAPHTDSVESVIDYRVPPGKVSAVAIFDGSVVVERTAGEVSARCHDEEANTLALNLVHDIVTGSRTADEAREYYAKEFADYRRKKPTPYMDELRIPSQEGTRDPDVRLLSDEDLESATAEGERRS
jgi:hypothetical protein